MPESPCTRSLKLLRSQGYRVGVVERWNPHARIRQDLFGIIDLVAIRKGHNTLGVQTTSYSNVSARVAKIRESEALPDLVAANWTLVVHGWRKSKGRWVCREVEVQ